MCLQVQVETFPPDKSKLQWFGMKGRYTNGCTVSQRVKKKYLPLTKPKPAIKVLPHSSCILPFLRDF